MLLLRHRAAFKFTTRETFCRPCRPNSSLQEGKHGVYYYKLHSIHVYRYSIVWDLGVILWALWEIENVRSSGDTWGVSLLGYSSHFSSTCYFEFYFMSMLPHQQINMSMFWVQWTYVAATVNWCSQVNDIPKRIIHQQHYFHEFKRQDSQCSTRAIVRNHQSLSYVSSLWWRILGRCCIVLKNQWRKQKNSYITKKLCFHG